jgi:hypothetical protein
LKWCRHALLERFTCLQLKGLGCDERGLVMREKEIVIEGKGRGRNLSGHVEKSD